MKSYKFKTNINCNGCVNTVTPYLNQLESAEWKVDIKDKRKILEVHSDQVSQMDIMEKVREAGYEIEPLKEGIWNKLFS
jgi:copper chaperone